MTAPLTLFEALERLDALARDPRLTNPAAQERLAHALEEHEHGTRHGDPKEDQDH